MPALAKAPKRIGIVMLVLLCLGIIVLLATSKPKVDRKPPKFIAGAGNWSGSNQWTWAFLLKLHLDNASFAVVHRDFKSHWLGRLDSSGTAYLFPGESGQPGQGGNGAVLLRNLKNNTVQTLVEPDNKGQYSIPRLYKDRVIYLRNRQIWSIGLDGSNNLRIFPPPDA